MNHKFSLYSTDYALTRFPFLQRAPQQICHTELSNECNPCADLISVTAATNKSNEENSCIPDGLCVLRSWRADDAQGEIAFCETPLVLSINKHR